jgi:hypothetical protein
MMVPVVPVEVRAVLKPQEEQEEQQRHRPALQGVSAEVVIHQQHLVTRVVDTVEAVVEDTTAVAVHQEVAVVVGRHTQQILRSFRGSLSLGMSRQINIQHQTPLRRTMHRVLPLEGMALIPTQGGREVEEVMDVSCLFLLLLQPHTFLSSPVLSNLSIFPGVSCG